MATQVVIHDAAIVYTASFPSATLSVSEPLIQKLFALLREVILGANPFTSFTYTINTSPGVYFGQVVYPDGRQYNITHTYSSAGDLNPSQSSFGGLSAFLLNSSQRTFHDRAFDFCVALHAQLGLSSVTAVSPIFETQQIPIIESPLIGLAVANSPYLYPILALGFPTSYSISGLPASLAFDTNTGLISGTPQLADVGTQIITIRATNPIGTGTAVLKLVIVNPAASLAPAITSPTTAGASRNQLFIYQITATGSPTSFGAVALPSFLSIDTALGRISGTPHGGDVGTYQFTVTATNGVGTGSQVVTLTVT